jgi:dolichol-phosphate mannosyltransferase
VYDEEASVLHSVRAICGQLGQLERRTALIVVDDGSRDATGSLLSALGRQESLLTVVRHTGNRGYGAAIASGAREAVERGFEYVLFMDCDLTNDPADIPRFLEPIDRGVDVVKATRYSLGGGMLGVPACRVLVSVVGNRIARRLLRVPIHDCTNGFRALSARARARMELTESGFPVILEELYWCRWLGLSLAEVPVVLGRRSAHQRTSTFRYRPGVFWSYLKYPLRSAAGLGPARRHSKPLGRLAP